MSDLVSDTIKYLSPVGLLRDVTYLMGGTLCLLLLNWIYPSLMLSYPPLPQLGNIGFGLLILAVTYTAGKLFSELGIIFENIVDFLGRFLSAKGRKRIARDFRLFWLAFCEGSSNIEEAGIVNQAQYQEFIGQTRNSLSLRERYVSTSMMYEMSTGFTFVLGLIWQHSILIVFVISLILQIRASYNLHKFELNFVKLMKKKS